MGEAKTSGSQLVKRNAAHLAREADRATNLTLDPRHTSLVRAHVRTEDVVLDVAEGTCHGTHEPLFAIRRHPRIAVKNTLSPAVREPGCGVFQRHCPGQASTLLGGNVRRHA